MPRGISEQILKPRTFWMCKSIYNITVQPTDIFAKILKVGDHKVFISRKSKYGFEDLSPAPAWQGFPMRTN